MHTYWDKVCVQVWDKHQVLGFNTPALGTPSQAPIEGVKIEALLHNLAGLSVQTLILS